MKRVAIVQSNYIPWKGYFDLINAVDEFVFLDEAQYTRRDWRNRNRIKTPQGLTWLTVPVKVKGRYHQRIDETYLSDPTWADRHFKTLLHNYAGAPHFADYRHDLGALYAELQVERLSDVNHALIAWTCRQLGIATTLSWSTDHTAAAEGGLQHAVDPTDRLVAIAEATGADRYLSGPAARAYLREDSFRDRGIAVDWFDYDGYPSYEQLHGDFDHHVTVLDLLFNTGPHAPRHMKTFGPVPA